jgi:hypothetical protein
MHGSYTAQRVSVIPSNTQRHFKEVQIKIPARDKTPPQQRKVETSSSPSRHTVTEVLVCISRGSSPEKQSHHSSLDKDEYKKKKVAFLDVSG